MNSSSAHERFRRFAERVTVGLGSVWMFIAAVVFTAVWAVSGFVFGFTDTWQLTLNTVASIAAFLMVFVIQNTQSRDARALHLKLDELLRVADGARIDLVDLENLSDAEMEELRRDFRRLNDEANGAKREAEKEREDLRADTGRTIGARAQEDLPADTERTLGAEAEEALRADAKRKVGTAEELRAETGRRLGAEAEEALRAQTERKPGAEAD